MINKKSIQIFLMICEVAFIIMFSLVFYLAEPIKSSKVVYIPKGSINKIISYLEKNNFLVSKNIDKYLLFLIGKPQYGWIDIGETKLTRGDFLYKLSHSKAAMKSLTLIPGETTEVFLKESANVFNLSFSELLKNFRIFSPFKEGLFIPETYNIPMGISEKHFVYYLVNRSLAEHKRMSMKIFGEYNQKKWYRYLIIASIIQKEAANKKEMSLISSVIYNRLKKNMKLQMDGSLNYGIYSHVKVTRKRIKEDKSRYNTYRYGGLPDDPVCNVSKDAIAASIFPSKSNYLFFVRNSNGIHSFSKSYLKHKSYIKKLQKVK